MGLRRFSDDPAATTPLSGSEIIPGVQTGGNVQMTAQDIADLAGGTSKFVQLMLSDMTTALTTGAGVAFWAASEDGELVEVWTAVGTVSSSGSVTVDMNDSGGSVFNTPPSIDASENTSLTGTPAVLDGTISFSKGDLFTFDIDAAGTGAKALMLTFEYTPT